MSDIPTIQVMIVDDTITYRSILTQIVAGISGAQVLGTASNGKLALAKIAQLSVDMVLLDIEMPEMDGLETLKVLSADYPDIGVVMISGLSRSSADITIRALESGAIDFITKPDGDSLSKNVQELNEKLQLVFQHFLQTRSARRVNINKSLRATREALDKIQSQAQPVPISKPLSSPEHSPLNPRHTEPFSPVKVAMRSVPPAVVEAVVIGVSTGGPNALMDVIPALPADLGVPVLIVQHMPPVFTASLANSLNKKSPLTVREAAQGEKIVPNTVYIAPGGFHMVVIKSAGKGEPRIGLNQEAMENSCRPAVDVLFRSIIPIYGKNVVSVIMTGMGVDGAAGVRLLKEAGAYSLSQSAGSCVVYGMPRAVEEAGLSDEVLDLSQIATRITQLVKSGR